MSKLFNILVIEDDEVDRINIERSMKKCNIANPLLFANNGLEALDTLKTSQEPLLIILDLNMPKMNGIEFLTAVRKDKKWHHTPVVVLTTSMEDRDRTEAYNLNVAGYIVKPLERENFIDAVTILNNYWSICEFPPAK